MKLNNQMIRYFWGWDIMVDLRPLRLRSLAVFLRKSGCLEVMGDFGVWGRFRVKVKGQSERQRKAAFPS